MKDVSELIRGEMAAVKSINNVLNKIKNDSERVELISIRQDHEQAVTKLKKFQGADVKERTESAGPWGAFTSAFAGGASFFGDKAALKALKTGEEHGLRDYKEALDSDDVDMQAKEVIRSELLPQQQRHLGIIDRYLQ